MNPDPTMDQLNREQRAAAQSDAPALLIEAGPGSGKTRVITHRVARILQQDEQPSVCAVTFTNKAATELKERIGRMAPDSRPESLFAGTYHSLCAKILRISGERIGIPQNFSVYDETDTLRTMRQIVADQRGEADAALAALAIESISAAKNRGLCAERAERDFHEEPEIAQIHLSYEAALWRASALDFDDLLVRTAQTMREAPGAALRWSRRYRHVLVDEFQDANDLQYNLTRLLASGHQNVCVVADPNQSIYSWRNASYGTFDRFERDYPGAERITLHRNYRSGSRILNAAASLVSQDDSQLKLSPESGREGSVDMAVYPDDRQEAAAIASQIGALTTQGRAYRDIAVCYRTNMQSRLIEEALSDRAIPSRVVGGQRFYQRAEIKDALAYLRLIMNHGDEAALRRVINTPRRGIGNRTIAKLSDLAQQSNMSFWNAALAATEDPGQAGISARAASALTEFSQTIIWLARIAEESGASLSDLAAETFVQTGYRQYIADQPDERAADRLSNLDQLVRQTGQSPFSELPARSALAEFLSQAALWSGEEESESQADEVTLTTLHQTKGLEWPVVFIAGLNEDTLPHYRSVDDPESLAEERRLLYVGITRAMEEVRLSRPLRMARTGNRIYKESRFLSEIPRLRQAGRKRNGR